MSNELVAHVRPTDMYSEKTLGYDLGIALVAPAGMKIRGASFPKVSSGSAGQATYDTVFAIPPSLTMGTGLTFKIMLTDDGTNAYDLGKAVKFGLQVKALAAGETLDPTVSGGTEQTVTATLQSTSGAVTIGSLAIASANLDSAVVGSHVAVRIRRIGSDAADTCQGRVIVPYILVINT